MSARIETAVLGLANASLAAFIAYGLASGEVSDFGYWAVGALAAFVAISFAAKLGFLAATQHPSIGKGAERG